MDFSQAFINNIINYINLLISWGFPIQGFNLICKFNSKTGEPLSSSDIPSFGNETSKG